MDYPLFDRLAPAAQRARSALDAYKHAALNACDGEVPDASAEKAQMICQMVDLLVVVEGQVRELKARIDGVRRAS